MMEMRAIYERCAYITHTQRIDEEQTYENLGNCYAATKQNPATRKQIDSMLEKRRRNEKVREKSEHFDSHCVLFIVFVRFFFLEKIKNAFVVDIRRSPRRRASHLRNGRVWCVLCVICATVKNDIGQKMKSV